LAGSSTRHPTRLERATFDPQYSRDGNIAVDEGCSAGSPGTFRQFDQAGFKVWAITGHYPREQPVF
jgi:hypothetical protein